MRLAAGTHTFSPTSPAGPPWVGEVSADGNMLFVGEDAYLYNPAISAYTRQEPGNPPGTWHFIYTLHLDVYVKAFADPTIMQAVPTEVGQVG